ncbi:MAG: rhomboid family intramembrane serine protease [Culturomica sp.]|jgi:membrane associated rhomboid family serine protease|nr:rhomboid family intramembrane serine protease [Culturomica sp.]
MNQYRPHAGIPPAVKAIVVINIAMFALTYLFDRYTGKELADYLGLHLPSSEQWRPWQYVTHIFMHGNVPHIFFNMFAVFMFGRVLEAIWGTKRFLFYYFATGLGAALIQSAVGMVQYHFLMEQFTVIQQTPEPGLVAEFVRENVAYPQEWVWNFIDSWTNNPESPEYIARGRQMAGQVVEAFVNTSTIGASGAVFGILLAFGMLFPNTELFLMFIPIPIKAKYFVIGYGLVELFLGVQNSVTDNVAHFAHLGGMLFGYLLIRLWGKNRRRFY